MPRKPSDPSNPQGSTKDRYKFADVCSAKNLQVKDAIYRPEFDIDYCEAGADKS
jgi:hypothetical protein